HLGYFINILPNENWINPVYWSLGIEFQYYLLIGLIFPLFIRKNKLFNILFLFIVTAICWFIFLYFIKGTYLHYGSLIFRFFPIFLTGISLFQLKSGILDRYSFVIFNLFIIVL